MDYFVGADPYALLAFKERNNLSDDLLTEFTTNESGDNVVKEGIMIALGGCEIVPHTIYINFDKEKRILTEKENDFQFKEATFPLKIEKATFCVFPINYLENFTAETVQYIINLHKERKLPLVELDNGWYSVELLAGLTQQQLEKSAYHWGQIMDDMEPTFEFCLKKVNEQPAFSATFNRQYTIEINKKAYKDRRIFKKK